MITFICHNKVRLKLPKISLNLNVEEKMWKLVTLFLIICGQSSNALECMDCMHTTLVPNMDCFNGNSSGICTGTACITYDGYISFSKIIKIFFIDTFIKNFFPSNLADRRTQVRDSREYFARGCSALPVEFCNDRKIEDLGIPVDAIIHTSINGCGHCLKNLCNAADLVSAGKLSLVIVVLAALINQLK